MRLSCGLRDSAMSMPASTLMRNGEPAQHDFASRAPAQRAVDAWRTRRKPALGLRGRGADARRPRRAGHVHQAHDELRVARQLMGCPARRSELARTMSPDRASPDRSAVRSRGPEFAVAGCAQSRSAPSGRVSATHGRGRRCRGRRPSRRSGGGGRRRTERQQRAVAFASAWQARAIALESASALLAGRRRAGRCARGGALAQRGLGLIEAEFNQHRGRAAGACCVARGARCGAGPPTRPAAMRIWPMGVERSWRVCAGIRAGGAGGRGRGGGGESGDRQGRDRLRRKPSAARANSAPGSRRSSARRWVALAGRGRVEGGSRRRAGGGRHGLARRCPGSSTHSGAGR